MREEREKEERKEKGKKGEKMGERRKKKYTEKDIRVWKISPYTKTQTKTVLVPVVTVVIMIRQTSVVICFFGSVSLPFTNSVTLFPTGDRKHEKNRKHSNFCCKFAKIDHDRTDGI